MSHFDVVVERQIANHLAVFVSGLVELVEHLLEVGQSGVGRVPFQYAIQNFTIFESLLFNQNRMKVRNSIERLFFAGRRDNDPFN